MSDWYFRPFALHCDPEAAAQSDRSEEPAVELRPGSFCLGRCHYLPCISLRVSRLSIRPHLFYGSSRRR